MEEEDSAVEILEDGELWLPSDFFSVDDVQASTNIKSSLNDHSTPKPCCMEDLAMRFSRFNVDERQNFSKSVKSLQGFQPEIPYRSTAAEPVACFGCIDGGGCTGSSRWAGSSPVYPYHFLNPVQSLLRTFIESTPWTSQRQPNRSMLNRVLPIPGCKTGMGGKGGTGVFLPRISADSSTNVAGRNLNNQCAEMVQDERSKPEVQRRPRKNLIDMKQAECHGYVSPPVSLPNDWSY